MALCCFRQSSLIVFIFFQNKTNSLSVAYVANRTSSPMESINSVLNRTVAKKVHFFRFVGRLRLFESKKAFDMSFAIMPNFRETVPKNKRCQFRDAKIKECTEWLDGNKIDVTDFLNELAADRNRMFTLNLCFKRFSSFVFVRCSSVKCSSYVFVLKLPLDLNISILDI